MSNPATLAALDAERQAARARLEATFTLLKARSSPSAIAARAVEDAREKASLAGQQAVDTARENPLAVGGAAAVIASLLAWTIGSKRRHRRHDLATAPDRETFQNHAAGDTERRAEDPKGA